jgi:hypothetical protein
VIDGDYDVTKDDVIAAIGAGKSVVYCGNIVSVEGMDYSWQEKVVWINHKNGSGYIASGREFSSMNVIG